MAHDPLACGDLIAERRYAYGKAAAVEGDWPAAADMFEQALELAPNWAPAWFALGEAREKLGDADAAAKAFAAALAADPSDRQGATARLALLGRADGAQALAGAYVARLFDDYASHFDAHLVEALGYRGPALIADALNLAAPGRRFTAALDVGCGTGLMGAAVRQRVDRLAGVDLSTAMIAKARGRGLYDTLEAGDAIDFLLRAEPGAFDCILAADALCYFGDLKAIFGACRRALADGGLFAFSIETFDGEAFQLQATLRFTHARAYVEAIARAAGCRPLVIRAASTRREAGVETPGLVCVFEAQGG
jgi:predicted TPR repeat methyltransferase